MDTKSWQKIDVKGLRRARTESARMNVHKSGLFFNLSGSNMISESKLEGKSFDVYKDPSEKKIHMVADGISVNIKVHRVTPDGHSMYSIVSRPIVRFFLSEGYPVYDVQVCESDGDIILTPIGKRGF